MFTKIKQNLSAASPQRLAKLVTSLILAFAGVGLISYAAVSQGGAPQPAASAAGTIKTTDSHLSYGYSKPVSLNIPAINVNSELIALGKNPDGTIAIPKGNHRNYPAWYKYSVTPGQPGAAVIEGHLDTYSGPSVFFDLGKLKPGEKVFVKRADDKNLAFTITAVRSYAKTNFPTNLVYAPSGKAPELRLITCGGDFNSSTESYNRNTVVYASLSRDQSA